MIKIKRVYEPYSKDDGFRILVERLWPRGVTKERAHIDLWMKDIAPSTELRKWFHHDRSRWREFEKCYLQELEQKSDLIREIEEKAAKGPVTLIYSSRDTERNNAVQLLEVMQKDRIGV